MTYKPVQTITTVGYGDIVAITVPGKILAIFTMIFGSLSIVLYTAFFAGVLIAPEFDLPGVSLPSTMLSFFMQAS